VHTVTTLDDLRNSLQSFHTIGFIPTMGALHAGHMALIDAATAAGLTPVVSIFVNPLQFGVGEDLARYPRTLESDVALCFEHGAALVWTPTAEVLYPEGFGTKVLPSEALTGVLCGAARPGHFTGVATVVTKLLRCVRPAVSFFGEKDYQQLCVIKNIHRDLHLDGRIQGIPTVREADGLALSSRNRYLSAAERAQATALIRTLRNAAIIIKKNGFLPDNDSKEAIDSVLSSGFSTVDYFEVRHGDDLRLVQPGDSLAAARVFIAARLGNTRLIDNIPVQG
jgi:pantoate--beta-alanine ligase